MKITSEESDDITDQQPAGSSSMLNVDPRVGPILFYLIVSTSIVLVNALILTKTLPLPVFVSFFQNLVAAFILLFLAVVGKYYPAVAAVPLELRWYRVQAVLPVTVPFVLMITFNNICLKYVAVSSYQVARSLTIIFNILLSQLILRQKISGGIIAACLIVMAGFVIGSLDSNAITLSGAVTGTLGSFFWAMYSCQVKKVIDESMNGNELILMWYNIILSLLIFPFVIVLAGEHLQLGTYLINDVTLATAGITWGLLIFSGIIGMLMTFSVYMCIRATSPLTYNILGTIKSTFQTVGGLILFGEVLTLQSAIGIVLSMAGSALYGQIRLRESKVEHAIPENENSELETHIK
eukprot:Filipodium_phascolosomae@DN1255_c0_g1_i2.p1